MYTFWRCCFRVFLATAAALSISFSAEAAYDQENILVGRIAHVDGKLLRYVDDGKDWVVTGKDTPFGLQDALYSGEKARAELILPNKTWLRMGENTQVQLFALTDDATTLDVASGTARIYNKSRDVVCKATTPFGYVVAPGGSVFDLYVGDESMEVIAVRGNVDVVHDATRSRYSVQEGAASLIADRSGTARGNGTVDSLWDDWNGERDRLWSRRLQSSTPSTSYLPDPIQEDSYVLEENGRWERVYYEGDYYNMWRPTRVDSDWRPFSAGRWTVYYGDNCWVPDEPFGYLTHHYGSWVYIDSFRTWYWLPPVRRVVVSTPHFLPVFGWYPGRVGWIHHGHSIGWVPLAPNEDYYGHHPWGRRTVVIKRTAVPALSLIRYRYLDAAVIIDRDRFYQGSRYTPYLQHNVSKAVIINTYQPVAVINNTVIKNFDSNSRRFAFSDAKVDRKPHSTVVQRIVNNQQLVQNSAPLNQSRIQQELNQVATAQPSTTTTNQSPVLTSKLVDAQNVSKPLNTNALPKKEIKPKERQRQLVTDADPASQVRPPKEDQRHRPERKDEQQRMQAAREARNQLMEQSAAVSSQTNQPPTSSNDRVSPTSTTVQPGVSGEQQSPSAIAPTQQPTQRPIVPSDPRLKERHGQPSDSEKASTPGAVAEDTQSQSRQGERRLPIQEERTRNAGQQSIDQITPPPTEFESQRRIRSPRELPSQEIRRPGDERAGETQQRRPIPTEQPIVDQAQDRQDNQQAQRRIRSPREMRDQSTEGHQPDLLRQQETVQRQQEEQQNRQQEMIQRQQEEQQQRRQQEFNQRQQEEQQRRQQETIQRQQDEKQQRQQQESIQRQQEEQQRRQQEVIQRQQEDQQRRQQEMAERQQEEQQRRQQEAIQRQQEEQQRRQQETIQRQQEEQQRRQQEAIQRQQEEQQRRQQEAIQRQQEEQQRRQQEAIQRQQEEQQRRQQEAIQRQQEEQQRRQQEAIQRQQEEQQRRQQEALQRQQEEQQRRQQEAIQRQQAEQQRRQTQPQQQQQQRKKTPQEEELLQQGQPLPR